MGRYVARRGRAPCLTQGGLIGAPAIEAGVKHFLPSEFGFDVTRLQNRAGRVSA
jgi:hypothetical protein